MELISSAQNPKIKSLLELQSKSKARRESGLFVVEGRRELEHCLEGDFSIECVFRCTEFTSGDEGLIETVRSGGAKVFDIGRQVYEKVAYREGTEGLIAEVRCRGHRLQDLNLPENPLVVVLESVEKPGNLGAVLRSADASGADAVIVCDPLTDICNPNVIRSSVGAFFTVPIAVCNTDEAIRFLKVRGIRILTAQLQDSVLYYDTDMTCGTALVMGTESTGLTGEWRDAADSHIRIPMLGKIDSLNVSVSAAILLYEVVRQRRKK